MPELPEVETVCRGLMPVLTGARVQHVETRRAGLRYPFPQDIALRLQGRLIAGLSRRAKYLLMMLEDDTVLISHLGMSGSWRIENTSSQNETTQNVAKNNRHDHFILELIKDANPVRVIYNDPRRFGFVLLSNMVELAQHPMLKNIGVEPLSNEFSQSYLKERFCHKKTPLKSALLDQTIVAGLGNIYVCEALWQAGLSPFLSAQTLSQEETATQKSLARLVDAIRTVLLAAIEAGGSTLRDYTHIDGSSGYFQHDFHVYGREGMPCSACGTLILRIVQSGRSTFYCPNCQH